MLAEATPEALVVRLTVLSVVPVLKLARVDPVVIVKVSGVLYAGAPPAPRSVTLTAAWLEILMERGFIVTAMLVGVGGRGVPMVNDALLPTVPAVALMSTIVSVAIAVRVTVATPDGSVVAVAAGVKVTAPETLTENVTVAPLITPDAPDTVADTVVLLPLPMVVVPSDTTTEVGTGGGVPMVIGALPLIELVPTVMVARIVAFALIDAPAVNWVVATPDASVTAEAGVKEPAVALITVKETLTLGTTLEPESVTVAVTAVVPPDAIADEVSVT